MTKTYLYLHGFASGPVSQKAQYLKSQFQTHHQSLQIPDLNQPEFATLTLTRQLQQGQALVKPKTVLIGSSLGGLTAAWIAEQAAIQPMIDHLILLAPAFDFLGQWLPRLGQPQLDQWKSTGWLSVYHYADQCQKRLHYKFVTDARQYDETRLSAPIPTLILHGLHDQVISIKASQAYARQRPWVSLKALETDHGMAGAMAEIWTAVQAFCL